MLMRWFCDMDGVLVKQIGSERFDEMPWHQHGKKIWFALTGLRPTLLSFSPPNRLAMTYMEKRIWVDTELGVGVPLLVVPKDLSKASYCTKGDVLIDDSEPNCSAWARAGGISILHRDDIEATLAQIMKAKRLWRS